MCFHCANRSLPIHPFSRCADFDFDSPDALDEDALVACLTELKVRACRGHGVCVIRTGPPEDERAGMPLACGNKEDQLCSRGRFPLPKSTVTRQERKVVEVPEYDFTRHQRSERTRRVPPADVIVVEGILILHMQRIREMLNMKIFVDTDDDVRLARR